MRQTRDRRFWLGVLGGAALLAALAGHLPPAAAQGGSGVQVFGPKEYVRTTGAPNQYTDVIAVPAWVASPFTLHVQNGDPSGTNRVSSATIAVNGTQVAGPSDFNQNVAGFDRTVSLTAQTTLHVSLASKPGSYLILTLAGAAADHTAPAIAIASPADGRAVNTATPSFEITYGDAGSGVDTSTLQVTLDGADRTSLFTRRPGDASATLPANLALSPGAHVLTATIEDNAGNAGTATSHFAVDLAPPHIQVAAPAAGSYLATATPSIHVTYGDDLGVDLSTLKVLVDGVDRTALFTRTATDATLALTAATALPAGANQVTAQIADAAGNVASDADVFNVDLSPPAVTVASPASGARFGDSNVPIAISYRDDQAIATGSLQVAIDGHPVALTAGPDGASGTATGVADGSHTLTASVADRAGNRGSAAVSFVVDTAAPTLHVTAPAAGAFVATASPSLAIAYSDADAVATASFKVLLNGIDRTSLFTVGPTGASANLAGRLTLAEGPVTVAAQIANLAGIVGTTTSTFTVDTTPPAVAVTTPAGNVASAAPAATVAYSDAGSGIDPATVRVLLDGADVTGRFAVTASKAVGDLTLTPPLADGPHTLAASVADRAGNTRTATSPFTVDTRSPSASFAAPADDSFLHTPAPVLELDYSDSGTGVDPASVHLYLARGSDPETEITALFTAGAAKALGQIGSPLADGTYHLRATLADRAGNTATARATFEIDTVAPTYQIVQPAQSAVLANPKPTIVVAYQDDASGVDPAKLALRIDGVDRSALLVAGPDQATAALSAPLADGQHGVEVTVVDRAGNQAPVAAQTFTVDTGAPTLQASVAPPPDAAGWNDTPVTVTYACGDAVSSVATCPPPATVSTEGAGQVVAATAADAAGNSVSVSVTLNVDLTPPAITASAAPPPDANGWNNADVTVTFACTDALSGVASCPPPRTVTTEGMAQAVSGTATDVAGNQATASLAVSIDKTPPVISQLATPAELAQGATATVSLAATDDVGIASVVFEVGGATVATVSAPPYQFQLAVPADAKPGDTLTVTAVVADLAGNTASASRGVAVGAQGVVVGQALADATGLPLAGAVVQMVGQTVGAGGQAVTDGDGRYSLPVRGDRVVLQISRPADPGGATPEMLPVERQVSVTTGVGSVPVDARLTPVAIPVSIDASGGTLSAGSVRVDVPAGAVAAATPFSLTPLSGQGLPSLLPLGWSPVLAFDLRAIGAGTAGTAVASPLAATFSQLPAGQTLHLAVYDAGVHAWTMVAPGLASAGGTLAVELPAPGGYALVAADADPSLVVPDAGQPLPGLAMVLLPPDAASSGALTPPSLPPAGGTATAALAVSSSLPLPSGTVVQASVTESYSLVSGEQLSQPARLEDLVLYRFGAPTGGVAASFPVTPSQSFAVADLASGKVHLDILAGRESVRGEAGGASAVVVQAGEASLAIAAGSLPEDTAIDLVPEDLATFLPSRNGLTPLAQYSIDLGGETLALPAELSDAAGTVQAGDTLLLARITRIGRFGGAPRLVAVALAQVSGGRIVTQPYPGLPGITVGGEYVFYRSASPLGFVGGRVTAGGGGGGALVSTDGLPFVAPTDAAGQYTVPALAGTANVKATVAQTALVATGSVAVTVGQTASLDLALAGAVSAATVDPADGAVGVDPNAGITVTAADPLDPATATAANVQLFQVGSAGGAGNQPVAVRFVLAQGNRQLSIFPLAALQPATRYTLQVAGLATAVGGLVAVPSVTFTTRAVAPPNFNPDALVFAFPDADGNVAVAAPAGSFPAGSKLLIVDQTNGVVLTLTAGNDGSVSGELPATIDDVLQVTVTAPDKSTASFTKTQFVAPDGSVAVGSAGGTLKGPGGVELRIPEGALDKAVTLKIESFGGDLFPERPDVPSGSFGSGLKVSSPDKLAFKKEVKLAFPKPADAPDGSFFYVYRRLATADGTASFEVIDHAFVEGQGDAAKVVTASAPFPGFITGMGALAANPATSALASSLEDNYFFIMWSFERDLVGVASQGVLVGKVLRTIPPGPGQVSPTYIGIPGAKVYLSDDAQLASGGSQPGKMAVSQADGTFSLWDPKLGGGTRKVTATTGSETIEATAFEVDAAQPDPLYFPNAQIFQEYRNLGKVNITFPPAVPPPPPQIDVRLFTLDGNGLRVPAPGVLPAGTPLVIAFKSAASVRSATINGVQQTVTTPDAPDNSQDPLRLDARVVGTVAVGPPGVYTVVATALPPLGGPPVTATRSFLAVAAGGDNTSPTPGAAPTVIGSLPIDGATGVVPTTFPQVTFSEPVTHLPGNVDLVDSAGTHVDLQLVGVKADGNVANPVKTGDAVTSLTVQPITGLKYGETYTLSLAGGIVDQNQPPLPLAPYQLHFSTFAPQEIGATAASFASTRPLILGQRAYVGKVTTGELSALDIVDISNPVSPVEVGTPAYFVGRAIDVAGVENSPVTHGPLVAVAAGIGPVPLPSNIWLYDVSSPDMPVRVGAMSASTSAGQDGSLLRIVMKGGTIYASTFPKGIQVIDVQTAVSEYQDHQGVDFGEAITTEGEGFATDAVVNTIPLKTGSGAIATVYDLAAADFATGPANPSDPTAPVPTETLVVATGRLPLVVADPEQGGPSAVLYPPADSGGTGFDASPLASADGRYKLDLGFGLAVGTIQTTDVEGNAFAFPVALVVGYGSVDGSAPSGTPLLAVVDLSVPRRPLPIGFLPLRAVANSVVLHGSLALVGTSSGAILLVSLADPAHPTDAGTIAGAFGGRLAVTDSNLVVASSTGGIFGGVQTALLGSVCASLRNVNSGHAATVNVQYPFRSLDWTLTSGQLSAQDGFVLTDVILGDRLMAKKMSLPYLDIGRQAAGAAGTSTLRCALAQNKASSACVGATTSRSQLLRFTVTPSNGDSFALQAQYLLDRLDGDPDRSPEVPDSCAVVTQRYEFWREGYDAPEASDELSAARFKPIVSYQYFTSGNGPQLVSFNTAQRFLFQPTERFHPLANGSPSQLFPDSPTSVATLFFDCEHLDNVFLCNGPGVTGTASDEGSKFFGVNPLVRETAVRVIENGKTAPTTIGSTVPPTLTRADNLHLRARVGENGGSTAVAGPSPTGHPGCPECLHIHWRWAKLLTRSDPLGALVVSPRFDNHGGDPIIPGGSNQDVDIALLVPGDEEHPGPGQTYKTFADGQPISQSDDSVQTPLAFWYSATGHLNQDSFMIHGGFFSSQRVVIGNPGVFTSATVPIPLQASACPLAFQIAGLCPIGSTITNRSGHTVAWTATMTDGNGAVVRSANGTVSGSAGLETSANAWIFLPGGFQLFPTYILDIKVIDQTTQWSTERQSYVTGSGVSIFPF